MTASRWAILLRPPWRTLVVAAALLGAGALAYGLWSPGVEDLMGRHSRGRNALWMQHGWLGDDAWFVRAGRMGRLAEFRDPAKIEETLRVARKHGITDLFPHLCPAGDDGRIAPSDTAQVERFLDAAAAAGSADPPMRVLPWIGGARDGTAHVEDAAWRRAFVASAVALLEAHPRLAGVHVNIEPWPDGDATGLALLDELRAAMPPGRVLSVAAYPPPTIWHRFPDVHWSASYFAEVTRRCDQVAVMMYDTALRQEKTYQWLVARWTREVLASSAGADVLIGVPSYDDADSGWHVPRVESLENALLGLHAGIGWVDPLPARYQGVALYCEWETSDAEWRQWRLGLLGEGLPDKGGTLGIVLSWLAYIGACIVVAIRGAWDVLRYTSQRDAMIRVGHFALGIGVLVAIGFRAWWGPQNWPHVLASALPVTMIGVVITLARLVGAALHRRGTWRRGSA